jgi:hypothetical protein
MAIGAPRKGGAMEQREAEQGESEQLCKDVRWLWRLEHLARLGVLDPWARRA